MTQQIARHETLFTVPEAQDAPPALLAGRCLCGYVFFPPHRFGCEACGAGPDEISIVEIAARGILKSFARSHLETHPDGGTPYIVGEVLLDEGPALPVVLAARDETSLSPGMRVVGKLVPDKPDDQGRVYVDCHFAPEGGA